MTAVPGYRDHESCEQVAYVRRTRDPLRREHTGSVVGIHFEEAGMYKGTLIQDLMLLVYRAEQRAEWQRIADENELQEIFSMQIPITDSDRLFLGAA